MSGRDFNTRHMLLYFIIKELSATDGYAGQQRKAYNQQMSGHYDFHNRYYYFDAE